MNVERIAVTAPRERWYAISSACTRPNPRVRAFRCAGMRLPALAKTVVIALAAIACGGAEHTPSPRASTVTVAYCCGRDALSPMADASARYLVFLPLTELDSAGKRHPRLARSWEHSADHRQSTYHLRTDLHWQDGVPVTAHDVKFTLDLLSNPDVGYFPSGTVESITPDDSTVTIRSANGFGEDWWLVIYPKHIVERLDPKKFYHWDFWTNPVGNGPYKLVRYIPETLMEFEASPRYPLTKPKIRRVVLKFAHDAALTELLSGGVDAIAGSNPTQIAMLARDPRFRIYHSEAPTVVRALYWKSDHPLFSDRRVRRALALAIDRRMLLSALNLPVTLPIADGPYTSGQFLRRDLPAPITYDPVHASALLDSLGWRVNDAHGFREKNGRRFQFTALVRQDPGFAVISVLIQEQLRRVGVKMELQSVETEILSSRVKEGRFEAAFILSQHLPGWLRTYFGAGAPVGYRNPEVGRLIDRALATADPDVLDAVYRELMAIFREDAPITFLFPLTQSYFVNRRIHGLDGRYLPDPVQHMEHLWIEGEHR